MALVSICAFLFLEKEKEKVEKFEDKIEEEKEVGELEDKIEDVTVVTLKASQECSLEG